MASRNFEMKYWELKTGFNDNGPAWIGKVMLSKSGKMVYFNDHAFLKQIGISGNYVDVETGEEYWISSVKKNGTNRYWAGHGKIQLARNVLEEFLSITGRNNLDSKQFVVVDIPEAYPVDRVNRILNR